VFQGTIFVEDLNEDDLILRDKFVSEYMKDFDVFQAALRCRFQPTFAVEWGKRLYQCPYVQTKIEEYKRKAAALDPAEQDRQDRALVENTLRQAMQNGPYASRVAATKAFAEMKGWTKPDPTEGAEQALVDLLKEFASRAPV
jgi:hypothetical protein